MNQRCAVIGSCVLRSVGCAALLSTQLPGQHLQWTQQGHPNLGHGIALVNDLDGDFQEDLAVGVKVPNGTPYPDGEIWFLSSRDGSFLPQRLQHVPGQFQFNQVIALGDLDGDGYRDFGTGPYYQGFYGFSAVSGRTWQRLWGGLGPPNPNNPQGWGESWATELDVNGDGRPDILVNASVEFEPSGGGGFGTYGVIYAYSNTGQLLHRTFSRESGISWGPVIGRFADFDGDGCDDYLTGLGEPTTHGGSDIVSGRTGLRLFRVMGPTPGNYLGSGVAMCGDLDGDGRADLAVGGGGFGVPGSVQTFSSLTGQRLHAWYSGLNGDAFGQLMLGTVDLDQDGITDVIASNRSEPVTPGSLNIGVIHAFSGRDGSSLMRFTDTSGGRDPGMGLYRIAIPPAQGSVFPRFLGGASFWSWDPTTGTDRSRLYMFEGGPAGVSTIGAPCAGTLASAPRIGLRSIDATHSRVTLAGAEPGMLSLLVLGVSQPPVPQIDLHAFGFTGCTLQPAIDVIGVAIPGTAGIDSGCAFHDFQNGTAPSPGLTVYGEWVVLGSGAHWPGGTTAALRWYLQ